MKRKNDAIAVAIWSIVAVRSPAAFSRSSTAGRISISVFSWMIFSRVRAELVAASTSTGDNVL